MTQTPLIQPLFNGPLDLIGDVHGEYDALTNLLQRLGYDADGTHPENRRLVFVGDLFDRGPDSPAVLRLVKGLIEAGRAQCVMGNHELNLLRGKTRDYNFWFHRQGDAANPACADQRQLPESERDEVLDFVRSLPLALERDDLRVVHACWDDDAAEALRHERGDVLDLFNANERRIIEHLDRDGIADEVDRNLARQNGCAVKVLTSGKEKRAETPFHAGERLRHEARVPWWDDYLGEPFIVFGHYSRTKPESQNGGGLPLFPADPFTAVGNTMCIDLGVGGRAAQRRNGGLDGTLHLAALRWPEQQVVRDTGDRVLPH